MITPPKTQPERYAVALLVFLWLVCFSRAFLQSVVHDEALTYQIYLSTPLRSLFQVFDANNHFLNTLLMRLTTSLFGFSSLAMRLPALVGAAIFFASLYRFCRWALGATWTMLIAVLATALNPFILDFMVAARGYGLALAFWMAALALVAPQLESPEPARKPVMLAGLCAALSVTANLIFVPPVAILAAFVVGYSLRRPRPLQNALQKKRKSAAKSPRALWVDFFVPAAMIAVLFLLAAPLENAESQKFYTGAPSIGQSLRSLSESTIAHGGPEIYHSFAMSATDPVAWVLAPLFVLAGFAAAIRWRNLALLLITSSACGSAIVIWLLHLLLDFPYPADRTGIYFVAMTTLAVALLASIPQPAIQKAGAAISLLMIACFAIQFDSRYFSVWIYDAESFAVADQLASFARAKPGATFANSWLLEPALNFYRETRHYDQLSPFNRRPIAPGNDYYALTAQDQGYIRDLGLTVIYRGRVSGTVIAVPAPH